MWNRNRSFGDAIEQTIRKHKVTRKDLLGMNIKDHGVHHRLLLKPSHQDCTPLYGWAKMGNQRVRKNHEKASKARRPFILEAVCNHFQQSSNTGHLTCPKMDQFYPSSENTSLEDSKQVPLKRPESPRIARSCHHSGQPAPVFISGNLWTNADEESQEPQAGSIVTS
nr:hypothetical protein Iba_chr14dCG17210 [Ipomoea batatas]